MWKTEIAWMFIFVYACKPESNQLCCGPFFTGPLTSMPPIITKPRITQSGYLPQYVQVTTLKRKKKQKNEIWNMKRKEKMSWRKVEYIHPKERCQTEDKPKTKIDFNIPSPPSTPKQHWRDSSVSVPAHSSSAGPAKMNDNSSQCELSVRGWRCSFSVPWSRTRAGPKG